MSRSWVKMSSGIYLPSPTPGYFNAVWLSTYAGGAPLYELCGVVQSGGLPTAALFQTVALDSLLTQITSAGCTPLGASFGGFMIITDGEDTDDSDLALAFQESGAGTNPLNYLDQTIAPQIPSGSNGSRTNYGDMKVPLIAVTGVGSFCFDFAWLRGDNGKGEFPNNALPAYPLGATYEITIDVHEIYT